MNANCNPILTIDIATFSPKKIVPYWRSSQMALPLMEELTLENGHPVYGFQLNIFPFSGEKEIRIGDSTKTFQYEGLPEMYDLEESFPDSDFVVRIMVDYPEGDDSDRWVFISPRMIKFWYEGLRLCVSSDY